MGSFSVIFCQLQMQTAEEENKQAVLCSFIKQVIHLDFVPEQNKIVPVFINSD